VRQVIGGDGSDTTAATQAWLAATPDPLIRDLILIGEPEDPRSFWLTNHEAPVLYSPYGVFNPAVVTRGQVQAKVGLDVQKLSATWAPSNNGSTASTASASPAQLARLHFFDNWPVRILRCFMPSPGDANTLGCAPWFGGRVDTVDVQRGKLVFNISSFLNVVTQKVPTGVVEVTNTLASSTAVTLPAGDPSIPIFKCFTGSNENYIIADCLSPTANKIYPGNEFAGGYMVFVSATGATLAGAWSAIGQNGRFTDGNGNQHSEFEIYAPLPWPPAAGFDTFYVSKTAPINLGDEGSFGFPYVPGPQAGV
jgi:hypothetical protein